MDNENKLLPAGHGEVIPPHLSRPTHEALKSGDNIVVKIVEIFHENPEHAPEESENWEVRIEYPNGFVKGHQIAKGADAALLIPKVRNQLRGMHGGEKNGNLLTALPAKIEGLTAGATLTFEGDK